MKAIAVILAVAAAGCDWSLHRMQRQPRCEIESSADCNLAPPDGTVAMAPAPSAQPPPALTRALIERGRDRFDRICAPCHGVLADGDSQVARAMTLRRPPPLIGAAAASLSDARILSVIESGYGVMPSYRAIVAPADRYAILHYVRVLQHRDRDRGRDRDTAPPRSGPLHAEVGP